MCKCLVVGDIVEHTITADTAGGFLLTIFFKNRYLISNHVVVSYIVSQLILDGSCGKTTNPEVIPDDNDPRILVHFNNEDCARAAYTRVLGLVAEE